MANTEDIPITANMERAPNIEVKPGPSGATRSFRVPAHVIEVFVALEVMACGCEGRAFLLGSGSEDFRLAGQVFDTHVQCACNLSQQEDGCVAGAPLELGKVAF